jgi:rubrerythrin
MAFDGFRRSFDDLLSRATKPEERRNVAARMRETLVQAKVGLGEMRDALNVARERLGAEERELETVRRRKQLAENIKDRETVDVATRYEQMHAERVEVLRQKVSAQAAELALAERDVASMSAELRAAIGGGDMPPAAAIDEEGAESAASRRAAREAEATRRLEELKKRMEG